jgi:uncharacterized protein (UPF0264 family)
MVQLLISARDSDEALAAARAGAEFIDLKEPSNGALGAVPAARVAQVVSLLRMRQPQVRISATVGDLPAARAGEILARVERVASCGVDYVKVGLWSGPAANTLLEALATQGASIVPVFVADDGVDQALLERALALRAFPALMLDTADKQRGSLLERLPLATLVDFVAVVRASGMLAGLAGSLRVEDAPALLALAPDFAGFRGAVTRGDRAGALDPELVRLLRRRLAPGARAPLPAGA